MKKIGLFGSAFNPPHRGHVRLVETAFEFLQLDEILFVPTKLPPHKPLEEIWGYDVRTLLACVAFCLESPIEIERRMERMASLKEKNRQSFVLCYQEYYRPRNGWRLWEAEKEREGPSYTIDTLRAYHGAFPENRIFLLIGQDQAATFESWKEYSEIFKLATVCVATRPEGGDIPPLPFVRLPSFQENVASSLLREAWKEGCSFPGLVPEPVEILLEMLR
ncbi:MAG: nicotinate-nicotinamide nucleotide adenylyltransferase [Brevinematales bacterium]